MPEAMPDRRRLARFAVACLACVASSAPLRAQDVPAVHITEYGEYVVRRELGVLPPDPDAGRTAPMVVVDGPRFVDRTSRIEAGPCRGFGIGFGLSDPDPARTAYVTVRLTHPPLVPPDGPVRETSTHPQRIGREPGFAGYAFHEPWEAVPGTWTFAVLFGDTVLAEQRFEVVLPPGADAPPPGRWGRCDAPVS